MRRTSMSEKPDDAIQLSKNVVMHRWFGVTVKKVPSERDRFNRMRDGTELQREFMRQFDQAFQLLQSRA